MKYVVICEKSGDGWGAYPDLPGVGVVGDTMEQVTELAREAIELHVKDLRSKGEPVPVPTTTTDYVEASAD